jgi:hypothetical protein
MLHQRRNQQAPDTAIAIKKRVDGFKLGMHQRNFHQRRQGRGGDRVVMNEALDIGQQIRHPLCRRRHKRRVARPRAANPVLRTTQLAGLLAIAASAVEQQTVGIAQQANTDRQPRRIAQIVLHQPECPQVIGHLFDIVGIADGKTGLFIEQVDKRGLRALDLGSQQKLPCGRRYRAASPPKAPSPTPRTNAPTPVRGTKTDENQPVPIVEWSLFAIEKKAFQGQPRRRGPPRHLHRCREAPASGRSGFRKKNVSQISPYPA